MSALFELGGQFTLQGKGVVYFVQVWRSLASTGTRQARPYEGRDRRRPETATAATAMQMAVPRKAMRRDGR